MSMKKNTRLILSTFPRRSLGPACTPQHELTCADRHKYAGLLHRIKNSILPALLRHTSLPLNILWGCYFCCVCGSAGSCVSRTFSQKTKQKSHSHGKSGTKAQSSMHLLIK